MTNYELDTKASIIRLFTLPFLCLAKLWAFLMTAFAAGLLFLTFLTVLKPSSFTVDNVMQVVSTYFNGFSFDQVLGAFLIANIIWYLLFLSVVMAMAIYEIICYTFGSAFTKYTVLQLYHVKSISIADSFLGPAKKVDEVTKD